MNVPTLECDVPILRGVVILHANAMFPWHLRLCVFPLLGQHGLPSIVKVCYAHTKFGSIAIWLVLPHECHVKFAMLSFCHTSSTSQVYFLIVPTFITIIFTKVVTQLFYECTLNLLLIYKQNCFINVFCSRLGSNLSNFELNFFKHPTLSNFVN
jgi:hypothetical protein